MGRSGRWAPTSARTSGASSIGYSASVSGQYLTTELYQRLGIAEQCLPKSHLITGGERTGAVVARGDADIAVQQISELLPVPGIAHITPLPPDLQKVTSVVTCIAAHSASKDVGRSVIDFLVSPAAAQTIRDTGLEPAAAL